VNALLHALFLERRQNPTSMMSGIQPAGMVMGANIRRNLEPESQEFEEQYYSGWHPIINQRLGNADKADPRMQTAAPNINDVLGITRGQFSGLGGRMDYPDAATNISATSGAPGGANKGSLTAPAALMPLYEAASKRTGIPVAVLIAQAKQESGFNPNAVGKAGEIGLHQIKPSTAANPGFGLKGVDPSTLNDPAVNINFAADYLKARAGKDANFNDPTTVDAALAAYNAGGDPRYVQNVRQHMTGAVAPPVTKPIPSTGSANTSDSI
jgi:hypothetical protein